MPGPLRVVHYLNQFFGQIGGEDKADSPMSVRDKAVGPGLAVNAALGQNGCVASTIVCGDNFMAESLGERGAAVAKAVAALEPDVLVAGPAFGAGRYGLACAEVCLAVSRLGIPAVTAMHESNPAVELYRSSVPIVPCGPTAGAMRQAVADLIKVALRLGHGLAPEPGTCFSRGVRAPVVREKIGAARAVDMLLARLAGLEPPTELPLPRFERVPVAPGLEDLAQATIVLVTEGGLTPKGNPDRIEMSMATKFGRYSLEGLDSLDPARFDVAHGGYDNTWARLDPNRLLPLDAMRELESLGVVGRVASVFYTTAGNATSVENAARFGREIARDIREHFPGQTGVLLTAT